MKRRAWYLLAAGYGVWRIAELRVSRRHERALDRAHLPRRRERGFGWMVAAHLIPFLAGPIEVARRRSPLPPTRGWLARASLVALAGAAMLRLWVLRTLGKRWNVHVHAAPKMPITVGGPYRWVRHPNYAAVIVELAALPLAGGAVFTALAASLLDAVALGLRISDEEAALREVPAWQSAMAHKPRFFPRLLPRARIV